MPRNPPLKPVTVYPHIFEMIRTLVESGRPVTRTKYLARLVEWYVMARELGQAPLDLFDDDVTFQMSQHRYLTQEREAQEAFAAAASEALDMFG
jgi:hypothetical protein